MPWLLEEGEKEVMSAIDLFAILRFHAEFTLAVGGLIYFVHPICEGLSVFGPTRCLLLSIGTHDRCLLIDVLVLLGNLQRARRLILT